MHRYLRFVLPLTLAGVVATGASAEGHAEIDPAVKARQAQMQLYAFNLGILGGMAQGKTDYDAAAASAAAANLVALAGIDQSAYWVPGTDSESMEGSRSLPAIWENIPDVVSKGEDFAMQAAAMADVAGNGLEAVQGQMQSLGGTCSACHREYRVRNN